MRKLTKLLSALIVLVLATAFIGCGNPSSSDNGGGNSNSPTYTIATESTYYSTELDCGYIFHDDNSVSWVEGSSTMKLDGRNVESKWLYSGNLCRKLGSSIQYIYS